MPLFEQMARSSTSYIFQFLNLRRSLSHNVSFAFSQKRPGSLSCTYLSKKIILSRTQNMFWLSVPEKTSSNIFWLFVSEDDLILNIFYCTVFIWLKKSLVPNMFGPSVSENYVALDVFWLSDHEHVLITCLRRRSGAERVLRYLLRNDLILIIYYKRCPDSETVPFILSKILQVSDHGSFFRRWSSSE